MCKFWKRIMAVAIVIIIFFVDYSEAVHNIFSIIPKVVSAISFESSDLGLVDENTLMLMSNNAEDGTLQSQINVISSDKEKDCTGEIKLEKNYQENLFIPDGANITIDLNGYKLSAISGTLNHINVFGTLKVKDSSEEMTGLITANEIENIRGVYIASEGSFTFESGTISDYSVSMNGAGVCADINATVIINGGKVINNKSALNGGGLYIYDFSKLTLSGGEISGNTAENGGGIAFSVSSMEDSLEVTAVLSNNTATGNGGALYGIGQANILINNNAEITGNTAENGGAIYLTSADSILSISDTVQITENSADTNGGAIYTSGATKVSLSGSVSISNNTAQVCGGGLYLASASDLEISDNVTVNNNRAETDRGGGVYFNATTTANGYTFTMNSGTFSGNTSATYGGAISTAEVSPKDRCTITINNGTFTNNTAEQSGGAAYFYYKSDIIMNGGSVCDNSALNTGGGFYINSSSSTNYSSFIMNSGEISRNTLTAGADSRNGGGLYAAAYCTIALNRGKINENTNACYGGGVYVANDGSVSIGEGMEICNNVTNAVSVTAQGGGLYLGARTPLTMTGGKISGNSSYNNTNLEGGGIYASAVSIIISGGEICDNKAVNGSGGGIYDASTVTVSGDTVISGNSITSIVSNKDGGGISCTTAVLSGNTRIEDNITNYRGGGIACTNLSISENVVIQGNTSANGGGVYFSGMLTMTGGTIQNNKATASGGGFYSYNSITVSTISGGVIKNNTAVNGGGVYQETSNANNANTIILSGTAEVTGNTATTSGGGFYLNKYSRLCVQENAVITDNTASTSGGGVYVYNYSNRSFPDGSDYALEVSGGQLQDNIATTGRDIYVNHAYNKSYKIPYTKIAAAAQMDGASENAYWIDENNKTKVFDETNTVNYVDSLTTNAKSGVHLAYTFQDTDEAVAQIDNVTYPSVQAAVDAIASDNKLSNSEIIMLKDSREDVVISGEITATLDLNGKKLRGESSSVISVLDGANLTIKDSSGDNSGQIREGKGTTREIDGSTSVFGGGLFIYHNSSVTLESGTITSNSATNGSAVYVRSGSQFTMNGGIIENNTGVNTSAVYLYGEVGTTNNSFVMNGGEIRNNSGRGVYVGSNGNGSDTMFIMTNGSISGNTVSGSGGGVYLDGSNGEINFQMRGGYITENSANQSGGGIYIIGANCSVDIINGGISGNTANSSGGGIYIYSGTVKLHSGAVIKENVVTNATGKGGGICLYSTTSAKLYMYGAKVYDNNAYTNSNDLYLCSKSYFYKDTFITDSYDNRAAEYMNVSGIDCWYDGDTDTYYVDDSHLTEMTNKYNIKAISSVTSDKSQVNANYSLTAMALNPVEDGVAKIGEVQYATLNAAVLAASRMSGDVTIELLKDISESVVINESNAVITLDLQGHTITAPLGASYVFKIYGGNFTLDNTVGNGKLVPANLGVSSVTRAITVNSGSFTFKNGTISGFYYNGSDGGSAIYESGDATAITPTTVKIEGGTIENCTAANGGAIYVYSDLSYASNFYMTGGTITNCTATSTSTSGGGGAIYLNYTNAGIQPYKAYITGGLIDGNTSKGYGGGIRYVGTDNATSEQVDVQISGVTISNNTAAINGGGIYATNIGNATYPLVLGSEKTVTLIKGNSAISTSTTTTYGYGGGIYISSTQEKSRLEINYIQVQDNSSSNHSGGAYIVCTNVDFKNSDISGNTARNYNGGVFISAKNLEMDNCTIHDNIQNLYGVNNYGGGICINSDADGTKVVQNCQIYNNKAYQGGGMVVSSVYNMALQNVEVYGNEAMSGGSGGIMFSGNTETRTITLDNCNIHDNTANTAGGGIGSYRNNNGSNLGNLTLVIKDTKITENKTLYGSGSTYGGGGIDVSSAKNYTNLVKMIGNTEISKNFCLGSQHRGGGVMCLNASLSIEGDDVNITNNSSSDSGGGVEFIVNSSGTGSIYKFTMTGGTISNNTAKMNGGGIELWNSSSKSINANISGGTISNNTSASGSSAVGGGGIHMVADSSGPIIAELSGMTVKENSTLGVGGGICFINNGSADSSITLKGNFLITDNQSTGGAAGGIYISNTKTGHVTADLYDGIISGNSAATNGGGVYITSSSNAANVTISGTQIIGNTAGTNGGGIFNNTNCMQTTITGDTLITENTAKSYGGGIYVSNNNSYVEMSSGKLYANRASLGQDVYGAYSATYKSSYLSLVSANSMFSETDELQGICWIDENNGKTYENQSIKFQPMGKAYPLTLSYSKRKNTIVAVVNGDGYSSVQDAVQAISEFPGKTGTITMVDDSIECVTIPADLKITLNLNGYTLQGGGSTAVTCLGKLEIIDKDTKVTVDNTSYPAGDDTGTITGTSSSLGGGIYVNGGTVIMSSGQISSCSVVTDVSKNIISGGAIAINSGTFTLSGGTLCNNSAVYGSAVFLNSASASFVMTGGEISENTTSSFNDKGGYGVIYNKGGNIYISGGTITGNSAIYGGAIANASGNVNISASSDETKPVISNNTASKNGGAIYISGGSVTIGSAEIRGNRVTGAKNTKSVSDSTGGGIYISSGTLNIIDGALITGNSAVRGGGVYQNNGTVNIMGGTITKNMAQMGGGCAQNPLPSNSTTIMNLSRGAVYGNISTVIGTGNDFYSAYEGTDDYSKITNKPRLTLIAANDMGVNGYNVWKDDTYTGNVRLGSSILTAQYITGIINQSNNLQLTAAYYNTEIEKTLDTNFKVETLRIVAADDIDGMTDGTKNFDDGKTYNSVTYYDATQKEKSAEDMLKEDSAKESNETYLYNGTNYSYIDYNGKLYEREQAVEWSSGDDSSATNSIVRTFDTVTYTLQSAITSDGTVENKDSYTYRLWIEAKLPCSASEAEFGALSGENALTSYTIVTEYEDGKEIQVLKGYWEQTTKETAITISKTLQISIHSMKNGDTIKPTFETWIDGNENSETNHATCASKILTVSAAPKYNISLDYNSTLAYTGYFDLSTGTEVTEEEATNSNVIYGTMLGYGITAELYNEPSGKGLKGIEIPTDGLEFDLSFKGSAYFEGEPIPDLTSAPYIWAYKPNDTSYYGKPLGGTESSFNMNWNDEDDITKTTYYAYNSAPFNSGGGTNACYNGGGWTITGSQPTTNDTETTVHVTLNGYTFNYDNNPTNNSDGKTSNIFGSNDVKAFSAGYVQVIFPIDSSNEEGLNGYVQISMDAVVSKLKIKSLSGQNIEQVTNVLDAMNEYYGMEDIENLVTEGYAINERRYADNYSNQLTSLYLTTGNDGINSIDKRNYFDAENGSTKLTPDSPDTGNGDTPLNSTVYAEGKVIFSSASIESNEDDELYDTQYFNVYEYYYMTAMNLLQKFDADAYTPVGTSPIINKRYTLSGQNNSIGDGAFLISTSESATSWSSNATFSYDLTILYAAKPDGTNWTKEDVSATYNAEEGTYNDGGVADMDNYREENLLYFETMEGLQNYFGGNGVCVGILYEFRNCCIRNGRTITAKAKMTVTGEYEMTGNTYCTTNDVRGWITYRPYYKIYYTNNTLSEHLYNFNWTDVVKDSNNDITAYGSALDIGSVYVDDKDTSKTEVEDTVGYTYDTDQIVSESDFTMAVCKYADGYTKTQYRNGIQITGTHNGAISGNTLLLYTLNTSIDISLTKLLPNSNSVKTNFVITNGEREVDYKVTPTIEISSSAKKTPLVENGTQSTSITIEIELPKGLTYQDGSISLDYDITECSYNEGDLQWDITIDDNENGTQIIKLTTYVSDIDLGLPAIEFTCNIGDTENPDNDIKSNTSLPVKASIYAEYEEMNLTAAQTHFDTETIMVTLENEDGISKSVNSQLAELGEDLVYTLSYSNKTDSSTHIEIGDVLPYNGDGRDTNFTGGYRIKEITINFTDKSSYTNFEEKGTLKYAQEMTTKDLLADTSSGSKATEITTQSWDDANYTVTYSSFDDTLIQYASAENGIALYGDFPSINANGRFTITITLSPMRLDTNELITDTNTDETQTGDCIYANTFHYRKVATGEEVFLTSNKVEIRTINRILSGVVWMDQGQDGIYNSKELNSAYENDTDRTERLVEYPISGIDAYLYYAKKDTEGKSIAEPDTTQKVTDVLGNEIQPVPTDENGKYQFNNLAEGDYIVVFQDYGNDYDYNIPTDDDTPNQPLPFSSLSVTTDKYQTLNNGNRSKAVYDINDSKVLSSAQIYKVISMPAKEDVQTSPYSSPNWNLGLYYIDMTIQKQWQNMVNGIPNGTNITFDITGVVEQQSDVEGKDTQTKTVYNVECIMTLENGNVAGTYGDKSVSIIQEGENPTYNWTLEKSLALQAETADGKIIYTIEEKKLCDADENSLFDYYKVVEDISINQVSKQITYAIVNRQILYCFHVQKLIYVDKLVGDDTVADANQRFVFRIERFATEEDLKDSQNVLETFYTDISCTDMYDFGSDEKQYPDGVLINSENVTTKSKYIYSYNAYSGSNIIMVTQPGWYKITEMTDWSNTDYDYVSGSNTYLYEDKEKLGYLDYEKDLSNTSYVAIEFKKDTYIDTIEPSEIPIAQFSNIESEFAYRSGQAYAENNLPFLVTGTD